MKILPMFLFAALAGVACAQEDTLRALEKDIAAARGLEFKEPVKAKTIPRPKEGREGIQGYYSTDDKTLYLFDDISGKYERGVLIHEMVHALQDQHFGLAKLHQATFEDETELALAALIEGDATFTMIEVLKKDQPRAGAMLDAPLAKSRNLRNAFLYAQGARYVRALRDKGGWALVNAAYRRPPRSTAAVLHPDGVQEIHLGAGRTVGELGLIELFAAEPSTQPMAEKAAAGWKGDCETKPGTATSWTLAFATQEDAGEFVEAIAALRCAKNKAFTPFLEDRDCRAWRDDRRNMLALITDGARVTVLEGPDNADFSRAIDRAKGASETLVVWSSKEKREITFGEMIDRLSAARIVCVGEVHDSETHHRVQLRIVKALFAVDESLGVGMEMFQRPFQKALDDFEAGRTTEDEFLKASEYATRWGFDWSLYRPIVDFCRKNGIGLAALNVPAELTKRIGKEGWDALTDEEKAQLPQPDFQVQEHRDWWYDRLGAMHGGHEPTAEQKERSYQVMTAWDETMGATAADFGQARGLRRMVVLAGSGHIDHGFGIPARAAKRSGGTALTVHVLSGEENREDVDADFVIEVK